MSTPAPRRLGLPTCTTRREHLTRTYSHPTLTLRPAFTRTTSPRAAQKTNKSSRPTGSLRSLLKRYNRDRSGSLNPSVSERVFHVMHAFTVALGFAPIPNVSPADGNLDSSDFAQWCTKEPGVMTRMRSDVQRIGVLH
jgi:hypothetical protein